MSEKLQWILTPTHVVHQAITSEVKGPFPYQRGQLQPQLKYVAYTLCNKLLQHWDNVGEFDFDDPRYKWMVPCKQCFPEARHG